MSVGFSLSTQRARQVVLSAGFGLSLLPVPWGGSRESRRSNKWLPRADIPWFDPRTGKPTPAFAAFMVELAENRMGGINGTTLPAVQVDTEMTRAQVVATTTSVAQTIAYARGISESVSATVQVAQDNGLTGAGGVPPVPEPPPPPYYNEVPL